MKNNKKILGIIVLIVGAFSYTNAFALNAGYGYIKSVSAGNSDANRLEVQLQEGYELDAEGCGGKIRVPYGTVSTKRLEQIFSISLAAKINHQKVRFYSHSGNCNATFVIME